MPVKGVNLGGWLTLEPWLTPELFKGSDAPDEYTFCKNMKTAGLRRLRAHYREFITEKDFAWLAEHNVEAVRLPVGYWLFGDITPYQATFPYVDKALQWADKYGLTVLIDLHGAPGSQNGEMHSGRKGGIGWGHGDTVSQTLRILTRLANQYGHHPALLGISFLNEPWPSIPTRVLEQFYKDAHSELRQLCKPDAWLVFGDAFRPRRWYRRLAKHDYPNLYVDYHHYQIFSKLDTWLSVRWQVWRAKHTLPGKLRRISRHHPLIVGEWSMALRAEKVGKLPTDQRQELTKAYAEAQLAAMQTSAAWFYWTYKTERPNAWSFRHSIERGMLKLD